MKKSNFTDRFLGIFLCLSILQSFVPFAAAQTRRTTPAKPATVSQNSQKKQTCAGGWSGIITFKKTLTDSLESDDPGIRKNIDRIKHKTSRNYNYTARAVVDGTNPQTPVVKTKINFTDNDLNWGQEKVFDSCGSRENGHWFITESTDDRMTTAQASGSAESFNLNVDEMGGTYNFSMEFPEINGVYKREEHMKRSGFCQPKNNEPFDRSTNEPTKVERSGFSIDSQKIDPKNPDTLSGTKIWGDDGSGAVRTFVMQVTWRFTRCPQKLLITDLKFEHPKFPDFGNWQEIEETRGTIDGNRVKVKATVLNMSAETKYADLKLAETYKGDKYNGARPDETLPEGEVSLRLEAGEEREVELVWDSEGQSWFDDGRPHLLHRIKAELSENSQKKDELEKPLNIAPKPLVLVHGVYEDYKIWEPLYQNLLTLNHSYQWKAYAVGAEPQYGMMKMGKWNGTDAAFYSVYDNADQLATYVKHAQEDSNAWHVDIVAHSTGGLVARAFVHKMLPVPDARPQVKHLLMLGTPNGGAPCVDVFVGKLGAFKTERSLKELTNEEMQRFNQFVKNTNGARFSALAGNPVPIICGGFEWNDGFVTVNSAKSGVEDFAYSNDLNSNLVDGRNFGNFVKPHLVTGPKKTYPLPVKSDPNDLDRWKVNGGLLNSFENNFANVSFSAGNLAAENPQQFAKELKLTPNQTTEIEMPVEAAANLGVTFLANPAVAVALINEKGVVVSKNAADSPLAAAMFRTLFTKNPVAKSIWKLRIENTSGAEQTFAAFSWSIENQTANKIPTAD